MRKNSKTATAKRTSKKTKSAKASSENRYENNLELLRKRRVRVKSCLENLKAIVDGTADEVDPDHINEAVSLLRAYNKRLLKAVNRNKGKIEAGEE